MRTFSQASDSKLLSHTHTRSMCSQLYHMVQIFCSETVRKVFSGSGKHGSWAVVDAVMSWQRTILMDSVGGIHPTPGSSWCPKTSTTLWLCTSRGKRRSLLLWWCWACWIVLSSRPGPLKTELPKGTVDLYEHD